QNVLSFYKRFMWDAFGLKKWLKKNKIQAIAGISLQNTNFRLDENCPNYIYYHQSIPLVPLNWSILRANERNLWFYKNIYPYFVKIFINQRTEIFVQLEFIKSSFAQVYNFPRKRIHVVFPKIEFPTSIDDFQLKLDHTCLNVFYPASNVFFKNHAVLFNAFSKIDKRLDRKIKLYLTNNEADFEIPKDLVNIEFVFLGQIPHKGVLWMFKNADALLFPSYIETLGLPLIEAAHFGLAIIAADLPYAREVLAGYKGVVFANYKSPEAWGVEILKLTYENKNRFDCYNKEDIKSWSYLFDTLIEKI
ncbi:MAG: glycosyltransferase, partial [Paludibacter sp.]